MNLVDSDGWLEYLTDGPDADFFAAPIEDTANLLVPATCLLEIYARICGSWGEGEALQAVAAMGQGRILDLDAQLAIEAAQVSAEEHLPLSGGVLLAAARAHNAILWSNDPALDGFDEVRYTGPARLKRCVTRVNIREQESDAPYWRSRPPHERMRALEEIRKEYHRWHYDAEPRLQRVHRIAER